MNLFKTLWDPLKGYKTYIIGAVTFLHGLVITGWQNNDWTNAQVEIELGLGLLGLRNALPKK